MPTLKDDNHKLSCTISAEAYDYLEQARRAAPLGVILSSILLENKAHNRTLEVLQQVEMLLEFLVKHHCPNCNNILEGDK